MKKIETERLMLEGWSKKDAPALYAYAKNPNVGPHAGWKPHSNIAESKHVIKNIFLPSLVWKIIWKETGEIIGSVGLENDKRRPNIKSLELGYSLAEAYWGRGIMTEAAKAVIKYAFEVEGVDVLSIQTSKDNMRSRSTIKKLGFKYEGLARRSYRIYNGDIRDCLVYSMLKEEYLG